ncbi:MAG: Hsp33 family molecular chaperone HslO [Polyangiaceae bacterium]
MPQPPDSVVRAVTQDGAFRVIVALTTDTVKGAVAAQGVHGSTAQRLGELVTGSILVREAMAPGLRVQIVLQGANKGGSLVADSNPDGTNRGIVNLGAGRREVTLGPGSLMQVLRSHPKGIHQGVVQVPEGGISEALMAYMQESEQVASVIASCTVAAGDGVARSCGYFVQLLPEAERGLLMVMTERLASFPPLSQLLEKEAMTAEELLGELLFGMPFTVTAETEVRFGCNCSQERLLASLATLPKTDIGEMIQDNQPLEIKCDGCGKQYVVTPAELLAVVAPGAAGGLFGDFGGDRSRGDA